MFLTLWNTYAFFVTYASIDGWRAAPSGAFSGDGSRGERTELDRWVISELHQLIGGVTDAVQDFDTPAATRLIEAFVDDLSNWYVRRSRRRFWKSESDSDKLAAYATLHESLVTLSKLMAPMTPYLAEDLYQNLEAGSWKMEDGSQPAESVHLCDW